MGDELRREKSKGEGKVRMSVRQRGKGGEVLCRHFLRGPLGCAQRRNVNGWWVYGAERLGTLGWLTLSKPNQGQRGKNCWEGGRLRAQGDAMLASGGIEAPRVTRGSHEMACVSEFAEGLGQVVSQYDANSLRPHRLKG